MASVAKWLRQWIVVPPLVGSSPIVRPVAKLAVNSFFQNYYWITQLITEKLVYSISVMWSATKIYL